MACNLLGKSFCGFLYFCSSYSLRGRQEKDCIHSSCEEEEDWVGLIQFAGFLVLRNFLFHLAERLLRQRKRLLRFRRLSMPRIFLSVRWRITNLLERGRRFRSDFHLVGASFLPELSFLLLCFASFGDWNERTRAEVRVAEGQHGIDIVAAQGHHSIQENLGCYDVQAASGPQAQAW